MTKVTLRYVNGFVDRHGRSRFYYRRKGFKIVPLPGIPGSAEFMAAYNRAVEAQVTEPSKRAPAPRSIDDLAVKWYSSSQFTSLAPSSQKTYRRLIENLRAKYGGKAVAKVRAEHIEHSVSELAAQPTVANHTLKVWRHLFRYSIRPLRWRTDDPTRDVGRIKHVETSHTAWSEEQISQYESRWPSGTQARLALYLMLYTGMRRSDAVRCGPAHIQAGYITVHQQKGSSRVRPSITLPIHPRLAAEFALVPAGRATFLLTEAGKAFSENGIYNRLVKWADAAGLPGGLGPHGLRHAQGRRLAEAGCSENQIAAALGHSGLKEVQRYTRAARQKHLATAAFERIREAEGDKPKRGFVESGE